MTRVVVSGATGRLGSRILARCLEADDVEVRGALVRPGSPNEGRAVEGRAPPEPAHSETSDAPGSPAGPSGPPVPSPGGARGERAVLVYGSGLELSPDTVLLEAALVPAALEHAEAAARIGAPICVATTGFDARQRRRLEALADRIPVLLAPNLSLGVTVLLDLVETAARALAGYDLEVLEIHHRRKRDAPSGTAWALGAAGAAARGRDVERDAILARAGETGPRGGHEVGVQSLRGGDVIGEHTVFLIGETERVELTHRAATRDAFAHGAVTAARFLAAPDQAPGLYTMRDVLGLAER